MNDEYFMKQALAQAQKAFEEDEVPVGAVIVMNNKIIALTSAFNYLGSKYLPEGVLYVTVAPCVMCAGALYWSKIGRIVYGAPDEKNGYTRVQPAVSPFHPKTIVEQGLMQDECSQLMKDFFARKRK